MVVVSDSNDVNTDDSDQSDCSLNPLYEPYVGNGWVYSSNGEKKPVKWLRSSTVGYTRRRITD